MDRKTKVYTVALSRRDMMRAGRRYGCSDGSDDLTACVEWAMQITGLAYAPDVDCVRDEVLAKLELAS